MPAPRTCTNCGRRVVAKRTAKSRNRGRGAVYTAKHHDLCRKCWTAECDRERNADTSIRKD